MTYHLVEVYIRDSQILSRVVCENQQTCSETAPEDLPGCSVVEWAEETGVGDILDWPTGSRETVVSRVEVEVKWVGLGEGTQLILSKPE